MNKDSQEVYSSKFLSQETLQTYKQAADFCLDSKSLAPEHSSSERMQTYRGLVRNVLTSSLSSAYPITKKILSTVEWSDLISDFMKFGVNPSPKLWKMPYSMYSYIADSDHALKASHPFLEDLLLFEWAEIQVYMMSDRSIAKFGKYKKPILKNVSEFWDRAICLNLDFELFSTEYPVHLTSDRRELIEGKSNYFILCFREPSTLKVKYLEVSPLFAVLLETMVKGSCLVTESLVSVCNSANIPINDSIVNSTKDFISLLNSEGMIFKVL